MTYPTADEHDALLDAYAQLDQQGNTPTADVLHERTGVSVDACQAWLDHHCAWPKPTKLPLRLVPDSNLLGSDTPVPGKLNVPVIPATSKAASDVLEHIRRIAVPDLTPQIEALAAAARLLPQRNLMEVHRKTLAAIAPQIQIDTKCLIGNWATNIDTSARVRDILKIQSDYHEHIKRTLGNVDWKAFADRLRRAGLPTNLSTLDFDLIHRQRDVLLDGIPLIEVPRASIAEALLWATSTQKRYDIIAVNLDAILDDCEALLNDTRYMPHGLPNERETISEAITCLRSDHHRAAQALASNMGDTFMWRRYRDSNDKERQHHWNRAPGAAEYPEVLADAGALELLTFVPAWASREQFHPTRDEVIPTRINRHASLHAVGPEQYTPTNAVIAIMQATVLWLWYSLVTCEDDLAT